MDSRAQAQSRTDRARAVMLAGGGSGGHISPGLAIAERLRELDPSVRVIFVCSQRPIDAAMLREAGERFAPIPATPPSLRPLLAWRFVINFFRSRDLVRDLIRRENVDRVVTLGGFIAAPAVSAARALGAPVTLINLDAPPGRANRWIARRCDEVLSAVPTPALPTFADRIVGLPIRKRALAPGDVAECRARLGLDPTLPTLLVTGASQGAGSINAFMAELARSQPQIFAGWQVLHLSGHAAAAPPASPGSQATEDGALDAAYAKGGVRARVLPFLADIGLAWGAAELALSRAGANSVAEVAANAVPALFLPYPYHKDMHQKHNAQPLVDLPGGGAVLAVDHIDAQANVREIGPVLRQLMQDDARRADMRSALRANRRGDAAAIIARIILDAPRGAD